MESILFFTVGAFWRAWFGGGISATPIWDAPRIIKYVALVLTVAAMYYAAGYAAFWLDWRFWAAQVAFLIFWAKGHTDYYIANDTSPDKGKVKWIDWCLRKIYGEGGYYNFKGNVTGMFLRYTAPAVLVALAVPNVWFLTAGFFVAGIYGGCGKLLPTAWYTKAAEFAAGGIVFLLMWEGIWIGTPS